MTVLTDRFARAVDYARIAGRMHFRANGATRMTHLLRILLVAALMGVPAAAFADSYPPSHSCRKPYKPYKFSSDWEFQQFKDDVERYKRCIEDFVREQNDEAENHRQAAQDAIDEWNRYVRVELN